MGRPKGGTNKYWSKEEKYKSPLAQYIIPIFLLSSIK